MVLAEIQIKKWNKNKNNLTLIHLETTVLRRNSAKKSIVFGLRKDGPVYVFGDDESFLDANFL